MTEKDKKSCAERVHEAFLSRMDDIRKMHEHGGEYKDERGDMLRLSEYGLGIDYVAARTFKDQKRGYWRYQISWGGPSEEFRVYPDSVEFWFLDWFDGAGVPVNGNDERIIRDIVETYGKR